jgi:hypothetical protein
MTLAAHDGRRPPLAAPKHLHGRRIRRDRRAAATRASRKMAGERPCCIRSGPRIGRATCGSPRAGSEPNNRRQYQHRNKANHHYCRDHRRMESATRTGRAYWPGRSFRACREALQDTCIGRFGPIRAALRACGRPRHAASHRLNFESVILAATALDLHRYWPDRNRSERRRRRTHARAR